MAASEPASAEHNAPDGLRTRIDEFAVRLVVSNEDCAGRLAVLAEIADEAKSAGESQVAELASTSLKACSETKDAESIDALLSECITRMQQALDTERKEIHRDEQRDAGSASISTPSASASPPVSFGQDRELLNDFILECRDHLAQVETQMITLEKEPADVEAINTVFRAFHTVKGLAGFLDLGDILEVAHETESLLDRARAGQLHITPPVVDVVLGAADYLKLSLRRLEASGAGQDPEPAPEKRILLAQIRAQAAVDTQTPDNTPATQTLPAVNLEWADAERRSGVDRRAPTVEAHSVKVDTAKLDLLVDMAGELVIAESMVRHHREIATLQSPAVLHSLAQLARITSDLQKTAMSLRMVPVGGLFQKMNRLVRDLARKTGKQAELESIGAETQLDRNVVEELADPLMHMVRNSVDHGLESASERVAAGKDPTGRVGLRASHQAGQIVIEVSDDGRGLNRQRILDKAIRTGLVQDGRNLRDEEVYDFIFHPGFSTAATITDVSGRGVGMDVVKRQIQKLRGRMEIQSSPGRGTTFLLSMPLTLAIIDGLVVGVGSERYVVPIFSVREMLRPPAGMISTLEGRREVALVRGKVLPVVRLHQRFGIIPHSADPAESLLIVADVDGRAFCPLVDELIGKQEVVIKSLGESLNDICGVAGAAILGDGRVGLILDLDGIFRGRPH